MCEDVVKAFLGDLFKGFILAPGKDLRAPDPAERRRNNLIYSLARDVKGVADFLISVTIGKWFCVGFNGHGRGFSSGVFARLCRAGQTRTCKICHIRSLKFRAKRT